MSDITRTKVAFSKKVQEGDTKRDDPLFDDSFKKWAILHGHMCSGLVIGYRAAKERFESPGEGRGTDEEIVRIVEAQ